jgi:tetratricopeptide (TPR) repeat protein
MEIHSMPIRSLARPSARKFSSALLLSAALGGGGGLGACNQTPHNVQNAIVDYHTGNFAAAAALLKPDTTKKDENFVLNNCRYASCALAAGQLSDAQNAFLNAYDVINSVSTNDGGRSLGAVLVFEGVKVWKGEPFERAMTDYYLGLTYLINNEYDNARAAFQNSIFKVREYANVDDPKHYQEVESNFALGYLGLGLCNMRMGKSDLADAAFNRAIAINHGLSHVIDDLHRPGINTLVFIDAGQGPRKAAKGWYNEESAFGPTPAEVGPIQPVTVLADGQQVTNPQATYATVDTLAMAQERHWQDIDTIRKVKAVLGTGMMAGGTGMAAYGAANHQEGLMWAGIGTAVAGALVSASSQADIRSWEMLPRTVYIVPIALLPGTHDLTVSAANGGGVIPLHAPIKPINPAIPADNVFYFRIP